MKVHTTVSVDPTHLSVIKKLNIKLSPLVQKVMKEAISHQEGGRDLLEINDELERLDEQVKIIIDRKTELAMQKVALEAKQDRQEQLQVEEAEKLAETIDRSGLMHTIGD